MDKNGFVTIVETVSDIQRNHLVLPDIQRDFVWTPQQVCEFFNSLMQDFPVGTLIYWDVGSEVAKVNTWFGLVRDHHPYLRPRPVRLTQTSKKLTAVLDGQQRLTALNIGLTGCMHTKRPNKWWRNLEAYTERRLYLDLSAKEQGGGYKFEFLNKPTNSNGQHWFPVADILQMTTSTRIEKYLAAKGILDSGAQSTLFHLQEVIHKERILPYRTVLEQDIGTVQTIFARVNKGGTPLSRSDLILSTSIAQWQQRDAREEIFKLVKELEDFGFHFGKELILKASRMVSDSDINFRTKRSTIDSVVLQPKNWRRTRKAIRLVAKLVKQAGFTESNLTASNSLLPIIYYVYQFGAPNSFLTDPKYRRDRNAISSWLVRSLAKKGVWSSSVDGMLVRLRAAIQNSDGEGFPIRELTRIMERRGKSIEFSEEDIEAIADIQYPDSRVFMLLSLLTTVKLHEQLHVDHFFPRSRFTKEQLIEAGVSSTKLESYQTKGNSIANLILLSGPKNSQKSDTLPSQWVKKAYPDPKDQASFLRDQLLGRVPQDIKRFEGFYSRRRKRLLSRIRKLLLASKFE